jgi:hypothetical protein
MRTIEHFTWCAIAGAWVGILAIAVLWSTPLPAKHINFARTSSVIGDELCSRVEDLNYIVHPDAFQGNGLTAAEYEIAVGKLTRRAKLLTEEFREARNREEIAKGHLHPTYEEP